MLKLFTLAVVPFRLPENVTLPLFVPPEVLITKLGVLRITEEKLIFVADPVALEPFISEPVKVVLPLMLKAIAPAFPTVLEALRLPIIELAPALRLILPASPVVPDVFSVPNEVLINPAVLVIERDVFCPEAKMSRVRIFCCAVSVILLFVPTLAREEEPDVVSIDPVVLLIVIVPSLPVANTPRVVTFPLAVMVIFPPVPLLSVVVVVMSPAVALIVPT